MAKKVGISTGKGYVKGVYDEYAKNADYAKHPYRQLVTDVDLNTIKDSGWYYGISQNIETTHAPIAGRYFSLEVLLYSGHWLVQRFNGISESGDNGQPMTYVRTFYGGTTWSEWTPIIDGYNIGSQSVAHATKADSASTAFYADKAGKADLAGAHETKKITSEQSFRTLVQLGDYQSYAVAIETENLTLNGIAIPKGSIGYYNVADSTATLNLIDPEGNNITALYNYSTFEWTVRDKPAEADYATNADSASTAFYADKAGKADLAGAHETKKITSAQSFRTLVQFGDYQSYAVAIETENLTLNGIAIPKGSIGYYNVADGTATLNLIDPEGNNITALYNYSTFEWTVRDKPAEADYATNATNATYATNDENGKNIAENYGVFSGAWKGGAEIWSTSTSTHDKLEGSGFYIFEVKTSSELYLIGGIHTTCCVFFNGETQAGCDLLWSEKKRDGETASGKCSLIIEEDGTLLLWAAGNHSSEGAFAGEYPYYTIRYKKIWG